LQCIDTVYNILSKYLKEQIEFQSSFDLKQIYILFSFIRNK
jgi:hypothetical protein